MSARQCKCLASFYDDLANEACQPCQYSCLTCTNGTECLTCDTSAVVNRVFDTSTRYCGCNVGFYEDPTSKLCVNCNYSCYTCINPNSCATCLVTTLRVLDPSSQQCLCPAVGYFDKALTPVCEACDPTCYTCTTAATYCTGCNTAVTFRTLTTTHTCVCSDGYFQSSSSTVICS